MTKSVLITGAGSGFGREASLALACAGCNVIAATETQAQANEFGAPHSNIQVEKVDITTDDIYKVSDWHVDVLLNNAGVGYSGPLAEIPLDDVRQIMNVNVLGTLALTQQVLKQMIPRRTGRILIMSSVGGLVTVPTFGAYTMSKHALEALGKTLRDELASTGIDVALINPGPYATGFNDRMADSMWDWFDETALLEQDADTFRTIGHGITTDQLDPQEVADLVVKLVQAKSISAQNLVPPNVLDAFGT